MLDIFMRDAFGVISLTEASPPPASQTPPEAAKEPPPSRPEALGLFRTVYAPADYIETVNTMARRLQGD